MIKRRLLIIILGVLVVSISFGLPSKSISFLARHLLKHKYGVSLEWASLKGGFGKGISLGEVRVLNKGSTFLYCPQISSNIKFKDFLFRQDNFQYQVSLEGPVLAINKSPLTFQGWMLLDNKIQILVSGAQLSLQDPQGLVAVELDNLTGNITKEEELLNISFVDPDRQTGLTGEIDLAARKGTLQIVNGELKLPKIDFPPISINGGVALDTEGIKIEKGRLSLGELEVEIGGSIFADRRLNLEVKPGNREPSFLVRGSLDEPQIFTNWGVIETVFRIGGIHYTNGRLMFPRVYGEIQLPEFIPFELEGGLALGMDDICFRDITLAKVVNIDGEISRRRGSRLRLWVKDTKGSVLAGQLPEVLKPFISSHTVNARLLVYGGIDNLQGGGRLKLFSYPMNVVCRYRHNRFSFRSIGEGPFRISGSINLGKKSNVKIKGCFRKMDFADLMSLFTKDIDSDWRGIVDGEFAISGDLNDPLIQAKLEIENGQIGDVKFDAAYLNLEGAEGILNLKHSMVYYKEISAELTGYIDPRGKDLFGNINIMPAGDSFIWKGLNVVRDMKGKTIIFGQDVNENVTIRFKSPLSSDPENGGMDSEPEVKVEYKLLEDKSILIKMEENEGTVGIEHKVKF